jgi:hypothetical protein
MTIAIITRILSLIGFISDHQKLLLFLTIQENLNLQKKFLLIKLMNHINMILPPL